MDDNINTKPYEVNRQDFLELAKDQIQRDGLDQLLEYLQFETDFFTAPASTKYHGSYEGGLCEHSLNVYDAMHAEVGYINSLEEKIIYRPESIAIVSLFHDICKANSYLPSIRNVKGADGQWRKEPCYIYNTNKVPNMGHGAASVYLVNKYMELTDEEAEAIYWHMGAYDLGNYNTVGNLSDTYKRNILAFTLHRADMVASYIFENEEIDKQYATRGVDQI